MLHGVTTTTVHDIMMTAFLYTLIIMSMVCDVTTTKFLAMVQGVVFPITNNLVLVKTMGTILSHVPAIVIKVFFRDHYFLALEIVSWTEIHTILNVRLPEMLLLICDSMSRLSPQFGETHL
jgi:hypothetical protein